MDKPDKKMLLLWYLNMLFSFTLNTAQRQMWILPGNLYSHMMQAAHNIYPPPTPHRGSTARAHQACCYQAGHVWNQCLVSQQVALNPGSWVWEATIPDGNFLDTNSISSKRHQKATSCGCKKKCSENCKCAKSRSPVDGTLCKCWLLLSAPVIMS